MALFFGNLKYMFLIRTLTNKSNELVVKFKLYLPIKKKKTKNEFSLFKYCGYNFNEKFSIRAKYFAIDIFLVNTLSAGDRIRDCQHSIIYLII